MTQRVVSVDSDSTCRAALDLMRTQRIRRAPVVRKGKLVGMVSERDLLRILPGTVAQIDSRSGAEAEKLPVTRVMATNVVTLDPEDHLEDASVKMLRNRIGGMPVMENGEIVGMLTESDIFRAVTGVFDKSGVWRLSIARGRERATMVDLPRIVLSCGARLHGLIVHDRPGGEELTVMRLTGGDKERLLARLAASGYTVLESVDSRPASDDRSAA